MTLFEILTKNQKQIVHSNADSRAIYTWDQRHSFQCYVQTRLSVDDWLETSFLTLEYTPSSFAEAKKRALQWEKEL